MNQQGTTATAAPGAIDQRRKEAYFTATQGQLIWARFRRNRTAMVAGWVLIGLILMGFFAPFLSPYDPTIAGRDKDYENGAPQIPRFWDAHGFSFRPFIYGTDRTRSIATNFRWVTTINKDKRLYLHFFVDGWEYSLLRLRLDLPAADIDVDWKALTFSTHLFGADGGKVHLFGTDASGKDIFGRTLHAIWTSLAVGTIGVLISFVLSLIIGGVAGYYGGWIDSAIQMVTDAIRTVPPIPLFMAIAAFIPQTWSSEMRFFFISCVLGLINWPTLARRVRTHLLTERSQEYVLAAQLCGASSGRRPDDLVSLHGALGDRAQLHRAGAEGSGQLAGRAAAERLEGRCAAELPVVLHPGAVLHRPGAGLRLRRRWPA